MKVSVIGLGKLGLCTAACFAARGHKVYGVDTNAFFIEELKNRRCPIDETGLTELLEDAWDNFTPTDNMAEAISNTDFTAIIVPTPSNPEGDFTNQYVIKVLEDLAVPLKQKDTFHVVDVVSTVMPGSSENVFLPLLEKLTGKKCGTDFGLAYNPEFIALGSVVKNFLNPDMVLMGVSDETTGKMSHELYRTTCDNTPEISLMSLVNAEITKLSVNCFCTTKISFANELSMLCEKVPGADIDVISNALGKDSRIGSKYISGGLGFGGPCFPRDNIAFQYFAEKSGQKARLAPQVVNINKAVVENLAVKVKSAIKPASRVVILGLSYKPFTHIVEESQSIELARNLSENGLEVVVYDPKAIESAKQELKGAVSYADDLYEGCTKADAIILMTNWPEFETLNWKKISSVANKDACLIDSWRIFNHKRPEGLRYFALGVGLK